MGFYELVKNPIAIANSTVQRKCVTVTVRLPPWILDEWTEKERPVPAELTTTSTLDEWSFFWRLFFVHHLDVLFPIHYKMLQKVKNDWKN